ncbi:hypothetical protein J4233_03065 [Candidatus Pacearchaeota archaeon]|nr:hypothetical protein [Candidatus Pacearchaeota archaeon]
MIDVIAVAVIVLAAVVTLVVLLLKWRREKRLFGEKVKTIVEDAKNTEPSVLVG